MKKQAVLSMLQWFIVLVALAVAMTRFSYLPEAAHWLMTLAIGLSCLGLGDAASRLIKKEQPAAA